MKISKQNKRKEVEFSAHETTIQIDWEERIIQPSFDADHLACEKNQID